MSGGDVTAREALALRWHAQTLRGGGDIPPEERGDCVRACITSILGVPIQAMENCHGDGWWDRNRGEIHRFGYDLVLLDMRFEPPMDAYWIATLPSLNLGPDPDGKPADHCVVARGYTLIHDPSLGEKYDAEKWAQAWNDDQVKEGWVLVPLDPSALLAELEAAEAEIAAAMQSLRQFNHVEGEPLSEVAAVAESAYGFAQHRAEAAEARTAWLQEACDALVLTWRCETCGWETTMPVPGFAGDGRFHYGDDNAPCGPLMARRAALSLSDGKGQDT